MWFWTVVNTHRLPSNAPTKSGTAGRNPPLTNHKLKKRTKFYCCSYLGCYDHHPMVDSVGKHKQVLLLKWLYRVTLFTAYKKLRHNHETAVFSEWDITPTHIWQPLLIWLKLIQTAPAYTTTYFNMWPYDPCVKIGIDPIHNSQQQAADRCWIGATAGNRASVRQRKSFGRRWGIQAQVRGIPANQKPPGKILLPRLFRF